MRTIQVNLRLEPTLVSELERAAGTEHLERGAFMRKLLLESLERWRLDHALARYQSGELSIGRACEETGLSHWEWIELAQARNVARPMDPADSIARAREYLDRAGEQVAESSPGHASPVRTGATASARRGPRRSRSRSEGAADRPASGGSTVNSLPDHPPGPDRIVLVGVNPAPRSVARGHYYQGKIGGRTWDDLVALGLLASPMPGHEDESWIRAGHGLTDVVKRPTPKAGDLGRDELEAGATDLRRRLLDWRPGAVLFVFKAAAAAALGRRDVLPGACGTLDGVPCYLLPGPYLERGQRRGLLATLRDALSRFAVRPLDVPPSPAMVTEAPPGPDDGASWTQPIRRSDLDRGVIRIPAPAKSLFPHESGKVRLRLRGHALPECPWDPRSRPRGQSGVLRVGKRLLRERCHDGERLAIRVSADGWIRLD